MEELSDEELAEGVAALFEAFPALPRTQGRPFVTASRWSRDPLFLGSYAHVTPQGSFADAEALAAPILVGARASGRSESPGGQPTGPLGTAKQLSPTAPDVPCSQNCITPPVVKISAAGGEGIVPEAQSSALSLQCENAAGTHDNAAGLGGSWCPRGRVGDEAGSEGLPRASFCKGVGSCTSFGRGIASKVCEGSAKEGVREKEEELVPVLLFAGEATHGSLMGTMGGAYLSGVRESRRLLQAWGLL